MADKKYYTIGEVEKICGVTQRMLRYYEKQDLVVPDKINPDNHYRYYTSETMRRIQGIRYLIDTGFSLDDIRNSALSGDRNAFRDMFVRKVEETCKEIDYYYRRLEGLHEWGALFLEGDRVLAHQEDDVSIKYFPTRKWFRMSREYDSEALIESMYYTLSKKDNHMMVDVGGAFYYFYGSYQDRMDGKITEVTLQQPVFSRYSSEAHVTDFGGFLAARSFHIGSYDTIRHTYQRILGWCDAHAYTPRGDVLERRVLDVYSTQNEEEYVTEVILPVTDDPAQTEMHQEWTGKE